MSLADLPPELLTMIFVQLSYKSLLCVQAVCVQWNAIVGKDSELSVQTFKRPSKVYVEPACREPSFRDEYRWYHADFKSQPIRFHPALNKVSYSTGGNHFYTESDDYHFCELAITNDFISIPAVTLATLVICDDPYFKITVKNSQGISLGDVFVEMHKSSNVKIVTEYGIMTRVSVLSITT